MGGRMCGRGASSLRQIQSALDLRTEISQVCLLCCNFSPPHKPCSLLCLWASRSVCPGLLTMGYWLRNRRKVRTLQWKVPFPQWAWGSEEVFSLLRRRPWVHCFALNGFRPHLLEQCTVGTWSGSSWKVCQGEGNSSLPWQFSRCLQ